MKLKDRIKTYNFWVSLSSAIFLIIKLLGQQFNFNVDESLFSDLFTTLCGILVIMGIIVPPTNKTVVGTTDTILSEIKSEDCKNNTVTSEIEVTNADLLAEETIVNEDYEEDLTDSIQNTEELIITENSNQSEEINVQEEPVYEPIEIVQDSENFMNENTSLDVISNNDCPIVEGDQHPSEMLNVENLTYEDKVQLIEKLTSSIQNTQL